MSILERMFGTITMRDQDMVDSTKLSMPPTTVSALHKAAWYDLLMWLYHRGKERPFREDILRLAALAPGHSVLDVGCGTGTLAIAAKQEVGSAGAVYGIDASPEMIARARSKARRQRADVAFENALAEAMPYGDARFDVVLSSLMLHHFPRKLRAQAIGEIRRVLKPDGRIVIVDFQDSGAKPSGPMRLIRRHRHGHVKLDDMLGMLNEVRLEVVNSGLLRQPNIYFVVATVPTT